jgi:hypothetical protein
MRVKFPRATKTHISGHIFAIPKMTFTTRLDCPICSFHRPVAQELFREQ